MANDEEDAEDKRPSTSNPENKHLKRKHASNNEFDKDRNQDNRFQSSELYELGQPPTSFGVANVTLDDTIPINENRQEAESHMMIGGLGLAEYHNNIERWRTCVSDKEVSIKKVEKKCTKIEELGN